MVIVKRNEIPIPLVCLPNVISKTVQPRMQRFEWVEESKEIESVKKCATNNTAHFYTVGETCESRRGSPLVKTDRYDVDRLIGVAAIMNVDENDFIRFHIIQEYMKEMCKLMGICSREVDKIELLPDPKDEKIMDETVDNDYLEVVEEPEFMEYNEQRKRFSTLEVIGISILAFIFQ
uniref:Tyrosine-protein phosphatase domain-containing protein n=2 Tax=Caenorhabditis tropicalis TaxID=1561998 RepID=A0A1I7UXU3_9PELO